MSGGIHFHKSWQCLTVTTSFIIGGVLLAQHMTLQLKWIIFLYILSILLLWIIGPQGTRNNPITEYHYPILYCRSLCIVIFYALLTLSGMLNQNTINLLLLAVLFGIFSIIPNKIRIAIIFLKQWLFLLCVLRRMFLMGESCVWCSSSCYQLSKQ